MGVKHNTKAEIEVYHSEIEERAKAISMLKGDTKKLNKKFVDEFCLLIASGHSIKKACAIYEKISGEKRSPEQIYNAIGNPESYGYFCEEYEKARVKRLMIFEDNLIDIADDATCDYCEGQNGRMIVDHENIARSKLRIETRKWLMAKLNPKRYGEKLEIESNNTNKLSIEEIHNQQAIVEEQIRKLKQ